MTTALRHRPLTYYLLIVTLLFGLGGCENYEEESSYFQGYVEGEFLYMAAPMGGILQNVSVSDGDDVTSGAVLFSIDPETARAAVGEAQGKLDQAESLLADARLGQRPSEINTLKAQLKQAQAALALSLKMFERQKLLLKSNNVSTEEYDKARSQAQQDEERVVTIKSQMETARLGARVNQVRAAEANVRALQSAVLTAKWNLEQTTQTAPQDSSVFDTYFYPGEYVAAGRPVVSLLPPGRVRVRVYVPETVLGKIKIGTEATIMADGAPKPFHGKVSFIAPKAEFTPPVIYSRAMRQKFSFLVEISFPPDEARELHPGQPVDVDFAGVAP